VAAETERGLAWGSASVSSARFMAAFFNFSLTGQLCLSARATNL
jgi:hypothetical protein